MHSGCWCLDMVVPVVERMSVVVPDDVEQMSVPVVWLDFQKKEDGLVVGVGHRTLMGEEGEEEFAC